MVKFCKRLLGVLALGSGFVGAAAFGQEVQWENIRIVGGGNGERCNDQNSAFVASGTEATLLLSTFGINLPKERGFRVNGQSWNASCNLEATVVIPQGYYLKTLTQHLSAGVLKDIGPLGGISTNGFLFQNSIPLNQINVLFKPDQKFTPENSSIERTNIQIFQDDAKALTCIQSATQPYRTAFKLQLLVSGNRLFSSQGFLLNVASQDVVFGLQPALERCF